MNLGEKPMPDEFPTLEVVALIGVLAALLGLLQLRRSMSEIPSLAAALKRALKAGDLPEVRAQCGQAEGAAFARIGLALADALGAETRPSERELRHVITNARKRSAKAAQRGRGRDLVVAAVLIGAASYAYGAKLDVGIAFFAMLGAALVVTALGPVLRRSMLDSLERESDGLLDAANAYLALKKSPDAAACSECGSGEAARIGSPALDTVRDLGLTELLVCKACGLVSGRVQDPHAIGHDEARGVRVVAEKPLESTAVNEPGHEG
jgi:hypothetical protein